MTKDTIAVFLTDYSTKYEHKYGNFAQQSIQVLRNAGFGGEVRIYDSIKSEFPTEDELQTIKAVWITGSESDAFADVPWINILCDYLKVLIDRQRVPIIGICFGHQIIGRVYGSRVGRNPKSWEFGTYEVVLNEDVDIRELFSDMGEKFKILEVHQDVVFDCPEGLKVIGSTDNTLIQGFYKKGEIISFQGHPEFTLDFESEILEGFQRDGEFSAEQVEQFSKRLVPDQGIELTKVILKFIE
jgi:GMP synthase (glutamine-hydrolysing)